MKLPQLNKIKWNYKALAFFCPFFGILMVMMFSGYIPFGKYSMLYSDMYHQYYPFFKGFRQALLNGDSLLYNWDIGMGIDYLGLISYYLASPLNLLSVLVPEKYVLVYFSFLVPIKLGFAGLFFAIFLNKTFKRNDFSITLFGSCYALCAWALAHQWNVMWLDTFALFPLVVLGTVSLLRDKKFILYTLTLFLSILTNYYVGLFTCIFVALFFFCYEICRFRGFKRFFSDLMRIAFFSLLAIGMTAILELPALAALQTTQSSVNNFPTGFKLNIADENTWLGLLDAMRQVAGNMSGGLTPSFKEGLPNLSCGISSVMLAFLFLTTKKVSLRDKICSVGLLVFFMLSFILKQLDYIWHGFHFTNMIPHRFSFLFSFVLLYMAYRAWLMYRRFKLWQIIGAGIAALAVIICCDDRTEPMFLVYNLGLLMLYMTVAIYGSFRKKVPEIAEMETVADARNDLRLRKKHSASVLVLIMTVEMVLNVINWGICFPGTNISNYPKGTEASASMIRYMTEREEDTPFYRAEVTRTQTLNDGALNNFHGVSTFTSSANVSVTKFMKALGYPAKNTYNRYCYEIGSPVTELFLNLKYLIDRDNNPVENPFYTSIYEYEKVHLLKNNLYLPLGFLTESTLADLDITTSDDGFEFQNTLFQSATGVTGNVWTILPKNLLEVIPEDVTVISNTGNGSVSYEADSKGGTLTYRYTVRQEGYMCVSLNLSAKNKFNVLINEEKVYNDNISLPQVAAVGMVYPGDIVDIEIPCDDNEKSRMNIKAAIINNDVFQTGFETLSACPMELTEFSNTQLSGTVTCNRDGLLYTSVPQNGNWFALVDGEPAEITLIGGAMIGLELTEGEHTVELYYDNAAFALGWKITLGCAVVFALVAVLVYYRKPRKGKYQK